MLDKNGKSIRTGCIVEITGAYFANDNHLYFVAASQGDPSWMGKGHCLIRISKAGKISKAKNNLCFWPIAACVSDRDRTREARRWNGKHAQIEIKTIENMTEVAAYFIKKANEEEEAIRRNAMYLGKESPIVKKSQDIKEHYEAAADYALQVATKKGE